MIAEALRFISELQTPKNPLTVEVGGQTFAVTEDGTLGDVVKPVDISWPKPVLLLSTLSGLVTAYKAGVGKLGERAALHVESHLTVSLVDLDGDEHGKRAVYAKAQHLPDTAFPFDKFIEIEDFLVKFRASFFYNDEAVKVQQLCATVGSASGVAVSDDGVSQEVTVKSGTLTKGNVTLPAGGIPLIPWRTFRDASPVVSLFLLRMRGVKDGLPQIALFEIDAKWKLDTVNSIRSYLASELPGATIIA